MKCLVFLLIIFFASQISLETVHDSSNSLFVWNVGQGLWATVTDEKSCVHFDTGGERAPLNSIAAACAPRENRFYFSHWDLDHISLVPRVAKKLNFRCLAGPPGGEGNKRKQKMLSDLPPCNAQSEKAQELRFARKRKESNSMSRVYYYRRILFPGDSSVYEEANWARALPARILILGHHGSRSSTSMRLLNHMPYLKMAVASSRQKKYGHPHKEVAVRLKAKGISLLRTDEWGTLIFGLGTDKRER